MSVSLSGSIQTRTAIMVEIDNNILAINRAFKERPESVDLSTLKNLLKQLKETNAEIKEKQDELARRKCLAGKCGTWTDRSLMVAVIVFAVAASITQIWIAILATDNKKLQRLAICGAVLTSGVTVGQVIQGLVSREVDSADDDEREERFFVRFMNAFEDYRNAENSEIARKEFKNCVKTLSEVPDTELKQLKLPPKPLWVESTAKMLRRKDPENELTQKINAGMERIAKTCTDKPANPQPFRGEQGHPVILEPINLVDEQVKRQFREMEEVLGCKLPFIAFNGKFYDREAHIYDSVEEAEVNTTPKEHTVVIVP